MAEKTQREKYEFVRTYLQNKAEKFKNAEDFEFFLTLFDLLTTHESRLRNLEREVLPGNAFIDPNEHSDIRHPLK